MLFFPATEWDSVVRNRSMCIPAGHVMFFLSPLGNLVTERSLPQGILTCFIPAGHVGPFVQYAEF